MAGKFIPHGTQFTFNAKTVGGLTSISMPERTRGEAESTDTNSDAREYLPGLRSNGTVEVKFRYIPEDLGQAELETNYAQDPPNLVKTCVITLPTGTTVTFDGYVMSPPKGELNLVDDVVVELTATIKVTGAVAIDVVSS
jgi:hypothetical protein